MSETQRRPLSIIIVNTNHRELLRQCLRALGRARLPAGTETIVVDNASGDGSAEMVEREFPSVRLVRQSKRRGPAANYNAGFREARGDYVVVLNEDAEVEEEALWILFRFMEAQPDVALCGPRLVYPDGRFQASCHRFPNFLLVLGKLLFQPFFAEQRPPDGYPQEERLEPFDPDWIMATSLMIRRSALEEVDLYDEQFEIYYEEVDLARRLRNRGWRVCWVPEAVVRHHHGVSRMTVRTERDIAFRLLLFQSRYRYFRKHHGALFTAAVRLADALVFALCVAKTRLEAILPSRRHTALLKTRLYGALLCYAIAGGGCPGIPQC